MKTISANNQNARTAVRQIGGSVTIFNDRLSFSTEMTQRTKDGMILSTNNTDYCYAIDSYQHSTGILRVAVAGAAGAKTLWSQWIPDVEANPWPNWVNSTIAVGDNCNPGIFGNKVHYLARISSTQAEMRFAVYNTGTGLFGTATAINKTWTPTKPIAFAPVADNEWYVGYAEYAPGTYAEGNYEGIGYYKYNTSASDYTERLYPGTIYDRETNGGHQRFFDAERLGGVDYVVGTDKGEMRAVYTAAYAGVNYRPLAQVIPMDVVDDLSKFSPSAVSVINSQLLISGILARSSGMSYQHYTMGTEHFTSGRDSYIGTRGVSTFTLNYSSTDYICPARGGKLHKIGDTIYYIGLGVAYKATAPTWLGGSNSGNTVDLEDLGIGSRANAPSDINFTIGV